MRIDTCGRNTNGRRLTTCRVWFCRSFRHHNAATAGTVLCRTRLPLETWFAAAYLAASLKPGVSALQQLETQTRDLALRDRLAASPRVAPGDDRSRPRPLGGLGGGR